MEFTKESLLNIYKMTILTINKIKNVLDCGKYIVIAVN